MTRLLLALLLCASPAFATPGDVQDPDTGEWGQPEKPTKPCNGGCDPKPERPDLPRDTGDGKTRRPVTEGYLCTATWQGKRVIFQHGEVEPGAEPVGECFCTSHPVGEVMTPWKGCR